MKKYKMIFSPTGGTAKVADAVAESWGDAETIDLADRDARCDITIEDGALAVIAMPSFAGSAPKLALDRLAKIKADRAVCAVVAVYGNRAYDDTLAQMKHVAEGTGARVIAAVAAVAKNSIIPYCGVGRPNDDDIAELRSFGERILKKATDGEHGDVAVPGNGSHKGYGARLVPKASADCNECGECARSCPAGAIDSAAPRAADKSRCIGCMRCVAICPEHARNVSRFLVRIAAFLIRKACATPKKNELFI